MSAIYALVDPNTRVIRYVGKTTLKPEARLDWHMRDVGWGSKLHVHRWIRKLGCRPLLIILEQDPKDCNEAECRWIAKLKSSGICLTNMTLGGDGWSPGMKRSASSNKKISVALKGNKHAAGKKNALGYKHTKEALEKMKRASIGKKHSEDSKKKISESKRKKTEVKRVPLGVRYAR